MFTCFNVQKTHYFSILYVNVGPLCPASLKSLVFYKAPPSDSAVCSDWPADPVHCDWMNTTSTSRKCNAPFHNRELQLSKLKTVNNVLSFTISSSPRGEQSCVTDTVMMLVCVCKQAAVVMWPCLPLSHTRARTRRCAVTLPLPLTHSLTHSHTLLIWTVNSKYLN